MGIMQSLGKWFGGKGVPAAQRSHEGVRDVGDAVLVHVKCDRCDEVVEVRLRKSSDIQKSYDEGDYAYFVQKTVVGNGCFNRMDLRIEFDGRYRPTHVAVKGGKLQEATAK